MKPIAILIILLFIFNCFMYRTVLSIKKKQYMPETIEDNLDIVKVHYYTNLKSMTDDTPNITAWNEPVYEGMVAISQDLLQRLDKDDIVRFMENGEEQDYFVGDKMHPRHKRSIDIFIWVDKYYVKDMECEWVWDAKNYLCLINKHYYSVIKKDLVYMPIDKCYITKADWKRLNVTYKTRLYLVR